MPVRQLAFYGWRTDFQEDLTEPARHAHSRKTEREVKRGWEDKSIEEGR